MSFFVNKLHIYRGLADVYIDMLIYFRKLSAIFCCKTYFATNSHLFEIIMHYKSTFKIWQYKNKDQRSRLVCEMLSSFSNRIIISYNCPTRKYDYLECQQINNYGKFQGSDVYCHVKSLCRLLSENYYDNWMALTWLIYLFW